MKPSTTLLLVTSLMALNACSSDSPTPQATLAVGDIATVSGIKGSATYVDNGKASTSTFGWITGVAVDSVGNVYVADGAANTVRKISTNGTMVTLAGKFLGFNSGDQTPSAGDGGPATDAHLNVVLAVAVDHKGNLAIADAGNSLVRRVDASSGTITTLAGVRNTTSLTYSGDGGPAISANLWNPYGVAIDGSGNVYIVDSEDHVVRKVDRSGIITTIAGLGPDHAGYTGDGGEATKAMLNGPQGICVDASGNVYISDSQNNVVRMISKGIISTIAGTGVAGFTGDGGLATAAKLSDNVGLAVDGDGNVYIADAGNNVVRKVTAATGIITTVAGNGTVGYSGDNGPATAAKLSDPLGVAIDRGGMLYIVDSQNSVLRGVRTK